MRQQQLKQRVKECLYPTLLLKEHLMDTSRDVDSCLQVHSTITSEIQNVDIKYRYRQWHSHPSKELRILAGVF